MTQVCVRASDVLIEAARKGAGITGSAPVPAVIRYALAKLAGWPDDAARLAAAADLVQVQAPAGGGPEPGGPEAA